MIYRGTYSPTETILVSDVQHQATRLYKIEVEKEVEEKSATPKSVEVK